jgi:hypothetical protein
VYSQLTRNVALVGYTIEYEAINFLTIAKFSDHTK